MGPFQEMIVPSGEAVTLKITLVTKSIIFTNMEDSSTDTFLLLVMFH